MSTRRWFGLNAGASNWLWLAVGVIALDQYTKFLIVENFAEFEELVLLPVLDLMRLHNEGAAFSFLSDATGWQPVIDADEGFEKTMKWYDKMGWL